MSRYLFDEIYGKEHDLCVKKFGAVVDKICKEREISIYDLTILTNTDHVTLMRVLDGRRACSEPLAYKLAEVFECSLDDLLVDMETIEIRQPIDRRGYSPLFENRFKDDVKIYNESFANILYTKIHESNYNYGSLAKALGIGEYELFTIVDGKKKPDIALLVRLSIVFDCPIEDFVRL